MKLFSHKITRYVAALGALVLALALLYFAVRAGWWVCQQIPWTALKKVSTFVLFWAFFVSLIRMWWKIGSYYGRKP